MPREKKPKLDAKLDALEARWKDAQRNERHATLRETAYWCRQYKLLAADLLARLREK
jgi:hypothetical protein